MAAAKKRGKLLGVGVVTTVAASGGRDYEHAEIRFDPDLMRYRYGDGDLVTMGIGTFGSRSARPAGSAIVVAADRLIDKGRKIAAHMMEAAVPDIAFADGRFAIAGTDRSVGIGEVAKESFHWARLPSDIDRLHRAGQFRTRRSRDIPQRRPSG